MSSAYGSVYGIAIVIYLLFWFVMMAAGIAMYVLHSLGMYTIAKRRGISNPFLAWIPVAQLWILGSIADQYDEAEKGVKKKSRVLLLVLEIAMYACLAFFYVIAFIFMIIIIMAGVAEGTYEYSYGYDNIAVLMAVFGIAFVLFFGAIMVLAIVLSVFMYIAYYKLFKSCRPDSAVLFLVLSIIIPFCLQICVFICRKDDRGMPVKEEVSVETGI